MSCPREAKKCAQFGYEPLLGRITMKCDGVECQQSCYNGDCDMICPHGVSTCTQEAYDGNMTLTCDADECHQVCYRDNCIMTCSERVNQCDQFCFKGNCQYECYAKICKHSCLAGPYKEGNSLASTHRLGAPTKSCSLWKGGVCLRLWLHELPEGKIILTCAGWENLLVLTNFPTKDTSKLFFKLKLIQLSLVFSAHLFLSAISLLTWRAQTDCMCSRDYIKISNRTTHNLWK